MKKRYFILTFVLILILPLLFACGNGSVGDTTQNTNAETTLSSDTTSPSNVNTEPRWPELIKDNKPLYYIIKPDESGMTENSAMLAVAETLRDVSGKTFLTGTDLITNQGIPDRYEILIGNTNRDETASIVKQLSQDNPYMIKQVNKRIVIVALSDKYLAQAVNEFLLEYTGENVPIDYIPDETVDNAVPVMPDGELQVAKPSFTVPTDTRTGRIISKYDTLYDIVADVNVLAYGAVGDGKHDDTTAFQAAIAAVEAMGGGTVFAPEGYYRLNGSLNLPALVTLAGELKPGTAQGTVLCIYGGKGEVNRAKAAIICGPHSSVQNIAFWYPEQTLEDGKVIPYPAAINQNYINGLTVRNVTFVNAYRGIDAIQSGAVLALEYLRDIYGTCLEVGYCNDFNLDIGKLENFHLSPDYWLESGLPGTPDEQQLRTYMLRNSVGIHMGQADFFYFSDIHIQGYYKGFYFTTSQTNTSGNLVANGQILNPVLLDCYYPIYIGKMSWFKVTGGELRAAGNDGAAAVYYEAGASAASNSNQGSHLYFTNVKLSSAGCSAVINNALNPKTLFYGCTITSATGSAIAATSSSTYDFVNTEIKSGNGRTYNVYTDDTMEHLAEIDTSKYAKTTKPASDKFINLTDAPYNARSGQEISAILQRAIDDLKQSGGMVYLPAGVYYVNGHIDLWPGVELRGCTVTAHVDMFLYPVPAGETLRENGTNPYREVGTVIYTNFGKNDPDGKEFIAMHEGSGIVGLSIEYHEQDSHSILPYSFTIRGYGKDIYVIDVGMSSSYNGIDFATNRCDSHYVEFLWSVGLNVGIQVGAGSQNGIIRDCHYTVNCWQIGRYSDGNYWNNVERVANSTGFTYVIGRSENQVLYNNFAINQVRGISLLDGAQNVMSVGTAIDYSDVDVYVEGNVTATVVNGQFVSARSSNSKSVHKSSVYTAQDFTGKVSLFNCAHWGKYNYVFHLNGTGEINAMLSHADNIADALAFAEVNSGSLNLILPFSTRSAITINGSEAVQALKVVRYIPSGSIKIDKNIPQSVITVVKK